jgi:hypothetical protein
MDDSGIFFWRISRQKRFSAAVTYAKTIAIQSKQKLNFVHFTETLPHGVDN